VIQQGQVFKLRARGLDGRPLWAYRYRLDGRGSVRSQVGGFPSRAEAEEALRKALARLRPGGLREYVTHYNTHRPHRALEQRPLSSSSFRQRRTTTSTACAGSTVLVALFMNTNSLRSSTHRDLRSAARQPTNVRIKQLRPGLNSTQSDRRTSRPTSRRPSSRRRRDGVLGTYTVRAPNANAPRSAGSAPSAESASARS
jgi:hypothetical protein